MEDSAGVAPGVIPIIQDGWMLSEIPGRPISVRIRLDVLTRLGMAVREGFKSLPRRGLETGGLLLGAVKKESGGRLVIDIGDFEPVESEHATGPSYLLSDIDRRHLESRISARESGPKGASIVGFYRSHTRRNFGVTMEDDALFSTYFRKSSDVFLLIKSNQTGSPTCGILLRENGKDLSASPCAQFPLDRGVFLEQVPPSPPPPSTSVSIAAPISIAAGVLTHRERREGIAIATPAPARAVTPYSLPPSAAQLNSLLSRWPVWLAIVIGAAIAMAVPLKLQRAAAPAAPTPAHSLALNVVNTGANLRLSWDHQASPRPSQAVLWIKDGNAEHRFELDAKQLSEGSISYWPSTSDVNFRLELVSPAGKVTESLRAIGAPPPNPTLVAGTTVPAASAPPVVESKPEPRVESRRQSNVEPPAERQSRSRTASSTRQGSRAFTAPGAESAPPASIVRTALPEPPALQSSAALPDHSPGLLLTLDNAKESALRETADTNVHVDVQPVPRLARNIPLIGKRTPRADYVGPVPVRKAALLNLPQRDAARELRIDVKLYVNPAGTVDYAELTSNVPKADTDLASMVLFSARRWEFTPAREGGDAVAGEVILHYRFSPGTRASAR